MTTVRRIRPDEGPLLRRIRLAALGDTPSAFGSSLAAEDGQPDEYWTRWARDGAGGTDRATFFATDGETVVGLVAGHRRQPTASHVELVSMWVAPDHRRSGVAVRLIDAVVAWADEVDASAVELWVTRGNDPAIGLYESAGFLATGDHQPLPSDPCRAELRMRRVSGASDQPCPRSGG